MELSYDRSQRPLEIWAGVLSATPSGLHVDEYDLEAIISTALRHLDESAPPSVKCLSLYVLGKALLRMREHYPSWSEWVACVSTLSGEWAQVSGDHLLIQRSESLLAEYVEVLRRV